MEGSLQQVYMDYLNKSAQRTQRYVAADEAYRSQLDNAESMYRQCMLDAYRGCLLAGDTYDLQVGSAQDYLLILTTPIALFGAHFARGAKGLRSGAAIHVELAGSVCTPAPLSAFHTRECEEKVVCPSSACVLLLLLCPRWCTAYANSGSS
eukprot:359648-Chlamydomonas_euryale.AAC.3